MTGSGESAVRSPTRPTGPSPGRAIVVRRKGDLNHVVNPGFSFSLGTMLLRSAVVGYDLPLYFHATRV